MMAVRRRLVRVAIAVGVVAAAVTATPTLPPAGARPGVAEFAARPSGADCPWAITTGPDQAVWATMLCVVQGSPSILRVAGDGSMRAFPLPGSRGREITTGPDGNLWVTVPLDNAIVRMTPRGAGTVYPLPPNAGLEGIAPGPGGAVWFPEAGARVGRLTPSGQLTEFPAPGIGGFISPGWDGNLWFFVSRTDQATGKVTSRIARMTPTGSITDFATRGRGKPIVGPGGDIWACSDGLVRIDRSGQESFLPGPACDAVTSGPDGNLWYISGESLIRMTPTGKVSRISLDGRPQQIAAGPRQTVWYTLPPAPTRGFIGGVAIPRGTFDDDDGSVHEAAIEALAGAGITGGCSADGFSFCPTRTLSRGQLASLLVRALRLGPATTDHFADDNGTTHEDSINRLAEAGITAGMGGGRFAPAGVVSREEAASFLTRAFKLAPADRDYFTDDDGSGHEDSINALAAAGVSNGCDASAPLFCPGAGVERGPMASFLARALELAP